MSSMGGNPRLQCNCSSMLIVISIAVVAYLAAIWFCELSNLECKPDYISGKRSCKASCSAGRFALNDMPHCHPWLNCYDIENDLHNQETRLLLRSVVKMIYLTKWKGNDVIISKPRTNEFADDFHENLINLMKFSPNPLLVQLVGYCKHDIVVTEYHKNGNALNFKNIVLDEKVKEYDNMYLRVRLCRDYAAILAFLHSEKSGGPRIMCDSSSLEKTLTQYLLTDDLGLVLADLDAIPVVAANGVICGHKELTGDFVAPEQRWPFDNIPFNETLMPKYNEKSDIWKVPDVCDWFLGETRQADLIRFRLHHLHNSCKSHDPKFRPTAQDILQQYEIILDELLEDY